MLPGYEFLGSAYFKTTKKELITSLESINLQLYKASATILVLDGEVKRLDSQNKIENKDTSSITYSRSFSQEKSVNTLELNRLDT